jgi:hypothetical protein
MSETPASRPRTHPPEVAKLDVRVGRQRVQEDVGRLEIPVRDTCTPPAKLRECIPQNGDCGSTRGLYHISGADLVVSLLCAMAAGPCTLVVEELEHLGQLEGQAEEAPLDRVQSLRPYISSSAICLSKSKTGARHHYRLVSGVATAAHPCRGGTRAPRPARGLGGRSFPRGYTPGSSPAPPAYADSTPETEEERQRLGVMMMMMGMVVVVVLLLLLM